MTSPEAKQVAREVAAKSLVVLKNDGFLLPLPLLPPLGAPEEKSYNSKIVLAPSCSNTSFYSGEGSGQVRASHVVSVAEGVHAAVAAGRIVDFRKENSKSLLEHKAGEQPVVGIICLSTSI